MKYLKFSKVLGAFAALSLMMQSCDKVDTPEPMGAAGRTIVKVMNGSTSSYPGYAIRAISLVATPQTIEVIDVRRDVPNESELNKSMTVTVKNEPGAITAYTSEFNRLARIADPSHVDITLDPLPAGSFSIDAANPLVGDNYTLTMAPGEFAKQLKISILNALSLDLSKRYAMGFTITANSSNDRIAAEQYTIVAEIGVKNNWDGIYKVEGNFVHPNACFAGPFGTTTTTGTVEVSLVTTGANTVKRDFFGYDNCFCWNNCTSVITLFSAVPIYQINANNTITIIPASTNGVSFDNFSMTYDPTTKGFNFRYGWNGSRLLNETWTYLRPR